MALVVLLGVFATRHASDYVSARYAPRADDESRYEVVSALVSPFRDDLLSACTGRLGVMADPAAIATLPQWRAFLTGRVAAFPCEAMRGVTMAPAPYGYEIQRHLHRALSTVFRTVGPRLEGVVYYQSLQFGVMVALLFGICRLAMGRILATLAVVPVMLSPRHLEMALAPLEYAKAPFFAACLLGVAALVVVRMSWRAAVAIAAATGASVGVGIGFKPDVLVFAPFGALAIALFWRAQEAPSLRRRGLLVGAYVVGLLLTGAPMLRTHFGGTQRSLLPVQILGGLAPHFTGTYATPAIYDYGVMFDDAHVMAVINSYNQRVRGSQEFGIFFSEVLQRSAFDLLFRMVLTFPGDLVLRAYAAVLQVMQFAPFGALAAAGSMLLLLRREPRLAAFAAFTVAYMVGYVSLVLAPKHFFHLEFVPWLFMGLAISELGRMRTSGQSWIRTLLIGASSVIAALVLLLACRAIQDPLVRALVSDNSRPDRFEPLAIQSGSTGAVTRIVAAGVVIESPLPDAPLVSAASFASPLVTTDYLAVDLECGRSGTAALTAVYLRPQDWRHSFEVNCDRAGQRWLVLWPVYQHSPYQVFDGFELSSDAPARVLGISRARDVTQFPLLLRMRLPDNWRSSPAHQQLDVGTVSPSARRPLVSALSLPQPRTSGRWDPPAAVGNELAVVPESFASWVRLDGVSVSLTGSGVTVTGNTVPFGYQFMSPPISVPTHSIMTVRIRGQVLEGSVAFGILDSSGMSWLLPPSTATSDFRVPTGTNDHVTFVFANNLAPGVTSPTRFIVQSVSYEFDNGLMDRLYFYLWPFQ